MTNSVTPLHLQDAAQLLTQAGFKTSNTWYHGTSSGLVTSILDKGLLPSGDKESIQRTKKAMITIGDSFKENKDPIFLTQSKELAYFWATKCAQSRSQLFGSEEAPTVLCITLPDNLNSNVKTDVGAAALLLGGAEEYLEVINKAYSSNGLTTPEVDPITADRMDYVNLLGMAYSKQSIDSQFIETVES